MQKIGKSLMTTIRNDKGYSFGGKKDRFYAPNSQHQSPPPTAYNIASVVGNDNSALKTKKSIMPHFTKD